MTSAPTYVHYGCGLVAPATWTNFDVSPTLRLQKVPLLGRLITRGSPNFPKNARYGDVVKGLPLAPDSCAAVYCSHVLEHLSLADFRTALRNTFKVVKPGGVFRFVLPDIELLAKQYLAAAATAEQPSVDFVRATHLGREVRPKGLVARLRVLFGASHHLWMWDYKSIAAELAQAGFTDIRRAYYHDSADPLFKDVEDKWRWDDCLGVECRKPGG